MLYTYINRHAGTPSRKKAKNTTSLDTAHYFYIGSRIGWVSALICFHIIGHRASYRLTGQETRFRFLVFPIEGMKGILQ